MFMHPARSYVCHLTPFRCVCFSLLQAVLDIIAIIGFSTVLQPLWSIKEFLVHITTKECK